MRGTLKCPNCKARISIEHEPPEEEKMVVLLDTDELAAKISDELEMRWRGES